MVNTAAESVIEIREEMESFSFNSEKIVDRIPLEAEAEGLLLACSNLTFKIKEKRGGGEKEILKGITASFRPGRVTAVMGSSGAGKTTLLSLLAGDSGSMGAGGNGKSFIGGEITLNGRKTDLKLVSKLSGFVYQDDVILPTMTVREAITMSARLRLPEKTEESAVRNRVEDMISILGLEKCASTRIGSATSKGISGGERKRVALAMELIPNPSILFLDEPTSGLDTVNAYNVVSLLSDLAHETSRTIIVTIHQPPSEIFHMLDDLLLLADGRVVYHGPAGEAVGYFAALGYPCPMYTNPADFFFLELLGNIRKQHHQVISEAGPSADIIQELCDSWIDSKEQKFLEAEQELAMNSAVGKLNIQRYKKDVSSFPRQFTFLFKRAGLNLVRDWMILGVKSIQTVVIALLIGLVYFDVGRVGKDARSQIQDRQGALYFLILNQFMGSSMGILSVFSKEKLIFLREHKLGYYKLAAYFLSKMLVELPYQIFFPALLITIAYAMVGFRSELKYFFTLMLVAILTALNGMAMGTLAAAAFSTVEMALVILPLLLIPMMIFSGLLVNNDSIPWYFYWIKMISPTNYAFTAAMKNEFTDLIVKNAEGQQIIDGNKVLQEVSMNAGLNIWGNVFVLAITYLVLMTASYTTLYLISRRKK